MIRCFNTNDVQNALESLLVDHQDQETVNIVCSTTIPAPHDHYYEIKLVRPDRDAIQLGPIVDQGNGKFTCFATIQIEIEVKPED